MFPPLLVLPLMCVFLPGLLWFFALLLGEAGSLAVTTSARFGSGDRVEAREDGSIDVRLGGEHHSLRA